MEEQVLWVLKSSILVEYHFPFVLAVPVLKNLQASIVVLVALLVKMVIPLIYAAMVLAYRLTIIKASLACATKVGLKSKATTLLRLLALSMSMNVKNLGILVMTNVLIYLVALNAVLVPLVILEMGLLA